MHQAISRLTACALLSAALTACGGSGGDGAGSGHASAAHTSAAHTSSGPSAGPGGASTEPVSGPVITIAGFGYGPSSLTVAPGATVTVTNRDTVAHTVTSDTRGAFDTGLVAPGASATFTAPARPGEYPYTCLPHPFMHGTLVVR